MPLGWIDFSKSERNKVLSVLDLLSESGTLDELGIAPVRDGFANLFFPGTSTIQTRAKYFLIVPYVLKEMEYSTETNPNRLMRELDKEERSCGEMLMSSGEDTNGIIGSRSLAQNRWVKRTPADIYWAGLRNYGIFKGGNLSLSEYIRAMCALKKQKATTAKLGNRNDNTDMDEGDDKDAGELFKMQFWKIPTYYKDWKKDICIKLSPDEGTFLKQQIITAYPDSMLSYILQNNITEIFACRTFRELDGLINIFPEQIQNDYRLAYSFSRFLFVLRVVYNIIVSDGQNEAANDYWDEFQTNLAELADVNLDAVFSRLHVYRNVSLCTFLRKAQKAMEDEDLDGLKNVIKRRERELKTSRAKTLHPGEFDQDAWFGGGELDYRFGNAKVIIRDILESEGIYVKSQ